MTTNDYTPCDEAWEAILDLIEANTPPAEPAEDDEEIEIAKEIDEILKQIDGGE